MFLIKKYSFIIRFNKLTLKRIINYIIRFFEINNGIKWIFNIKWNIIIILCRKITCIIRKYRLRSINFNY